MEDGIRPTPSSILYLPFSFPRLARLRRCPNPEPYSPSSSASSSRSFATFAVARFGGFLDRL